MKLLSEMPWFRTSKPILIPTSKGNLVEVDQLDMRLEVAKYFGVVPKSLDFHQWVAPLPNGEYLLPTGEVTTGAPPNCEILSPDWTKFAQGLKSYNTVKAAYDWKERGEESQEDLDRRSMLKESLISRLDNIF